VPSTTLTVTVLLPHRPPAHQTSCLSPCPACPLAKAPCKHSPSLDEASFLQALPAPDRPCDVCLAHLSPCVVHRGKSWARGIWVLGTGSETGEAERGEVGCGGCQHCVLHMTGTANPVSGGGGTTFPGTKICSRPPRYEAGNQRRCSHSCVLLRQELLSGPSAALGPSAASSLSPVYPGCWQQRRDRAVRVWRGPHAIAVGEAPASLSPQSRRVPQGGVGGPEQEGIQEEQAGELCCGALAEENGGALAGLGSGPRWRWRLVEELLRPTT